MSQLILRQTSGETGFGVGVVTDLAGQPVFHIAGDFGRIGDKLILTDQSQHPLAEIEQTAIGILPKFILKANGQEVGSFGLSLQFREILYISHTNWLVFGNTFSHNYNIARMSGILAQARAGEANRIKIEISAEEHTTALVLIVAFLERWQATHAMFGAQFRKITASDDQVLALPTSMHN
ncbi:MAG: hypothetical protein LBT80_02885 [Lactobacillaceae bacterium]|nr:hypothetical protein [Lactobacillaceae bacterium]